MVRRGALYVNQLKVSGQKPGQVWTQSQQRPSVGETFRLGDDAMDKKLLAALGLCAALLVPLSGHAKVFICVDPETGEKTFTDTACADSAPGRKIKVEPVNFDKNGPSQGERGTWNSDRDTGVSGSDNYSASQRRQVKAVKANGYLPERH